MFKLTTILLITTVVNYLCVIILFRQNVSNDNAVIGYRFESGLNILNSKQQKYGQCMMTSYRNIFVILSIQT